MSSGSAQTATATATAAAVAVAVAVAIAAATDRIMAAAAAALAGWGMAASAGGRRHAALGHAATGGSVGFCVPERGVACAVLLSNLSSEGRVRRRLLAPLLAEAELGSELHGF